MEDAAEPQGKARAGLAGWWSAARQDASEHGQAWLATAAPADRAAYSRCCPATATDRAAGPAGVHLPQPGATGRCVDPSILPRARKPRGWNRLPAGPVGIPR